MGRPCRTRSRFIAESSSHGIRSKKTPAESAHAARRQQARADRVRGHGRAVAPVQLSLEHAFGRRRHQPERYRRQGNFVQHLAAGWVTSTVPRPCAKPGRRATHRTAIASYKAEVVPWLWFLTQNANCRIFQKKTVKEILEQVFADRGFSDFETSEIKGNHKQWEYCVQYRETDFNFVSRLMEQEGIFYYFRHEDSKHVLVLGIRKGPTRIAWKRRSTSPPIIPVSRSRITSRRGSIAGNSAPASGHKPTTILRHPAPTC